MFVDAADLVADAAAEVLAMGVGVAAAEEDDDVVAVDMPFNGSMGSIEYLIATSLMPHGGGSMASTEARFTLSHFLIASDKLAVLVDNITRSGVGKASTE